jgi:hypothetical protein
MRFLNSLVDQMSDLTLCLITKGRAEYLGSLLASLDRCLKYDHIQVLVLLNGVEDEIAAQFNEWSHNYPAKVKLQEYQDNDARLSRFWPTILELKSKWVSFPSDDDVLNDSFLSQWSSFEISHSNFGAIATRLELIGATGSRLGVSRNPAFKPELSLIESTARAFSECPFLWPGLIIQVAALPKQIPDSRYVLDWWVGIYLLFTTTVQVSQEVFVNYRVHDAQESSVASLSRKNLEALTHFGTFVQGKEFSSWIAERNSSEIIEFLHFLVKYPPIYGDLKFSSEFVSLITSRVESLRRENAVHLASRFVSAYCHDVLIAEDQLKYFGLNWKEFDSSTLRANFNLVPGDGVCLELQTRLNQYNSGSLEFPTITVGCRHSGPRKDTITFDCDAMKSNSEAEDRLILAAEEHLRRSEIFYGAVSPFEYNFIRRFRRFKAALPVWLNRIIYGRMRG